MYFDATRGVYNVVTNWLDNTAGAESGAGNNGIDINSNGFKARSSNGNTNASSGTYVYAAFASNPFGGSTVAPATAR